MIGDLLSCIMGGLEQVTILIGMVKFLGIPHGNIEVGTSMMKIKDQIIYLHLGSLMKRILIDQNPTVTICR